jgi:D-3-phosphoglycerate dehydrogenase / 2-oxoglutarate reductase
LNAKLKILVCDPLSPKGISILKSIPNTEVDEKLGLSEEKLIAEVSEYDAFVVRSGVKITAKVLAAATKLRAIARAGMGYDNIDLDAATKKGVVVMNTPGQNAVTTAEHTIAMMMALARNIPQAQATLKSGKWDRKSFTGTELSGKVLGVVGLGNVGREVARRARGLKMEVVGYDPFISEKAAQEAGAKTVSLEELYASSDFITLHTVLNDSTNHMINSDSITKMKDRVRIVNCARGALIDETALLAALQSGKVAGAALDVFEKEPPAPDNPLLKHDRVVTTPHLGASTDEAQEQVALAAAEQIKGFFMDDMVINGVNVPSVSKDVLAALGSYIDLAVKIGRFLGQLGMEKVQEIRIECSGEMLKYDTAPITAGVLCGFMQKLCSESVNFVNAPIHAKERGIAVIESKKSEPGNYVSLVAVTLKSKDKEHLVAGSVFGRKYEKIVRFDNYFMEFTPRGHVLLIQNEDKPGVVGGLGTILGKHQINISQMQVALDAKRGRAISLVNIDTPAPKEVLEELRKVTNIETVSQMVL